MGIAIYLAGQPQAESAYRIVQEYYQTAAVVVREDAEQFARDYFGAGPGCGWRKMTG